ncbi:hypothetical protein L484_005603 [Morus notabilis]|uniref:NHL repeat-containing protein 2 n=1 Tax=Morus notabilis TaxID=981085 RepID=W9QV65_9ROSA|nr:hypothetical protein L484_005603 [Morus notabilis]
MDLSSGSLPLVGNTERVEMGARKLDPASEKVTTLAGTGKAGFQDGMALEAQLSEPWGIIEVENGRLFIADTINNLIRYLDLNKEVPELLTLELKGVQPPKKSKSPKRLRRAAPMDAQTVKVDGTSSSRRLAVNLALTQPENVVIIDPLDGYISPDGYATLHFRRFLPSASTGRINCKMEIEDYLPLLAVEKRPHVAGE